MQLRIPAKHLVAILIILSSDLIIQRTQGQIPDPEVDKRVDGLLAKFSLEDKIRLIGGHDAMLIRAIPSAGFPQVKMADGPEGVRTWGPETEYGAGIALAASWDPNLARRVGESMGVDARAEGVHILLAPAVNIVRAPMDGRDFEYFGEDPFLSARLAVPFIEGVQSKGVVATIKHYAANNQEYDRFHVSSDLDERTLREIYLPAFEASVKEAHVGSVMSALNPVNGEYATENRHLNLDILKGEWGFDGILMSDWGAVHDGVRAANAGLDLEMPSGEFMNDSTLLPAIQRGDVALTTIDDKVRRILRIAIRFGFLDHDQLDAKIPIFNRDSSEVALDSARESITLLKNEGHVLPLDRAKIKTIAVIGPDAWPAVSGGGSSQVTPFAPVSILQGIADFTHGRVLYARGLGADEIYSGTKYGDSSERDKTNDAWTGPKSVTIEAYKGRDFSRTRQVFRSRRIDAAHEDLPMEGFGSIRYLTSYTPVSSESYFVLVSAEAGSSYRLWVNDKQMIEKKCCLRSEGAESAEIPLQANKTVSIRLDYVPASDRPRISLGILPESQLVSEEAKRIAREADAVILSVGFDSTTEHEGADREFGLPFGQEQLIKTITALNKRTIVTISSGGNVDMRSWLDRVPALIHTWYPGQEGGVALAEILFGDRSPEGHLPVTFDRSWEESPVHDYYYETPQKAQEIPRTNYSEGVFVGYRYYTSKNVTPQFPFGFGLSYTTFAFSHLTVSPAKSLSDGNTTVSLDITNTGKIRGSDVAQVYVGDPSSACSRPLKELKGFSKVYLDPGETKRISIILDRRSFSYWDMPGNSWRVDPGLFVIYAGDSSANTPLQQGFILKDRQN
jgi:beta-glucosidase